MAYPYVVVKELGYEFTVVFLPFRVPHVREEVEPYARERGLPPTVVLTWKGQGDEHEFDCPNDLEYVLRRVDREHFDRSTNRGFIGP